MMMQSKILSTFQGQDFLSDNTDKIYIMDYTRQTDGDRGIEMSNIPPTDMDAFIIENNPQLEIAFCVFKDGTIKLSGETREKSHCEGILFPANNSDTTWITFLELKYPKKKNLGRELKKAREQLLSTLDLFREQKIIEEKRLVYLIFSAPKYTNSTPFENWSISPHKLKEIRKTKYAIMRGINNIKVISSKTLR
ncbi:MAG: hypothetical protein LBQ31_07420 [Bacteroidales bacterium]|jgi:hypothetical protein|nr:hypothetical protein [Bacteroidales bacterium]